MFKVGEVVFCPLRGSGVVQAIETRKMLNESNEYVIIHMKDPSIVMMITTDKVDKSGFREVNTVEVAERVENILRERCIGEDLSKDMRMRVKQNHEKLSSGSFISCGEVVRDLTYMEHTKPLNHMEKTMLLQAKKLLLDEFSIIKNMTLKEAEHRMDELLGNTL